MSKKTKITLVIADDHAILRSGLRMLFNAEPDMSVVGEAENGDQALEQVRLKKPNVLVMDIGMPGTGGLEAAREARKRSPATRIVILTMHTEPGYLESALAGGVLGYVLKRSVDSELISAIRAAHAGKTFVDPGVAGHLVRKALSPNGVRKLTPHEAYDLLSRRERQVLELVAQGYTSEQIAARTFIGVKSVETYRARLLKKLGIKTRREIIRFGVDLGLLSKAPGPPGAD